MEQWYKNAVVYGIDVSRFYDSDGNGVGDLRGIVDKLDYLQELGINCLWLMPFYPSSRSDNGYDVIHYKSVDEDLGNMADFRLLVDEAHDRNMKVIIDLVAHHTSSAHPWFVAASNSRDTVFHDYYVWSNDPPDDPGDQPTFNNADDSVWEYVPKLKAYYHHKFYAFEPDLNIANPDVWQDIKRVVDFWLTFGIDGFRIDAATHMFGRKGIEGTAVDAAAYIEELRGLVDGMRPGAIILGEADVDPRMLREYFGKGNRFHILYNFLLNNRIYLALARQSAAPIIDHLRRQRSAAAMGTWLNFIRTLDEVDLGHLMPDEFQEVADVFAPRKNMQIYGHGLRRNVAPMMHSGQQLRMVYSLLFSLPGVPMFTYGEELGMGENLALPDRSSIRLPMQWNGGKNAGFSKARPSASNITRDTLQAGPYGFKNVNASKQQTDPDSLLSFFKQLIALRKHYPDIGDSPPEADCHDTAVVSIRYPNLLCLHNLSAQKREAGNTLPNNSHVLLSRGYNSDNTLEPFGFCWIQG